MEAANLPTFLQFGNARKLDICVIFAKNHGWPRKWETGAKLPAGPKIATGNLHIMCDKTK